VLANQIRYSMILKRQKPPAGNRRPPVFRPALNAEARAKRERLRKQSEIEPTRSLGQGPCRDLNRKTEAMASTGLDGPHVLTNERIDQVVTQKSPGTYALDRTDDSAFRVRVGPS
jgi:hypothetical protein